MRELKKQDMRSIANHLIDVMDDLSKRRDKLYDIGCSPEAKKLDTVIGKLYDLSQTLYIKTDVYKL